METRVPTTFACSCKGTGAKVGLRSALVHQFILFRSANKHSSTFRLMSCGEIKLQGLSKRPHSRRILSRKGRNRVQHRTCESIRAILRFALVLRDFSVVFVWILLSSVACLWCVAGWRL